MEKNKTIQNQLNEIFEKYHAHIKNFGSSNTNKYFINDERAKDFENITNFINTIFFKDSGISSDYETEISSTFGKLMVKYCDSGLEHNDILSLMNLIYQYNSNVSNIFDKRTLTDEKINGIMLKISTYMKYVYGLYADEVGHINLIESNDYITKLYDNIKKIYIGMTEETENPGGSHTVSNALKNKVEQISTIINNILLLYLYLSISNNKGLLSNDQTITKTGILNQNIEDNDNNIAINIIKLVDFVTNGNSAVLTDNIIINNNTIITIDNIERSADSIKNVAKQSNNDVWVKFSEDNNLMNNNDNETRITLSTFTLSDYVDDPAGTGRKIKIPRKKYAFRLFTENEKDLILKDGGQFRSYRFVITNQNLRLFRFTAGNQKQQIEKIYLGIIELEHGIDNSNILQGAINKNNLLDLYNEMSKILSNNSPDDINSILSGNLLSSEYILSDIVPYLNRVYAIAEFENIRRKTMEIIYEFATPSVSNDEKLIVDDAVLNNINKHRYLINMKLLDIELDETDPVDRAILALASELLLALGLNETDYILNKDDNTTSGSKKTLSLYVIYKEFNEYYRGISESENYEKLFASYYLSNKTRRLNYYDLDDVFNAYVDYISVDENDTKILKATHSNSYIARSSNKFDIISYKYGDVISYGTNDTEIREIENFISIYKSTRDYFYRIQFNKAFALDRMYDVYCLMYIISWSIDRWFISKIKLLKDVRYYTLDDCKEFFNSYGMEDVANVIRENSLGESVSSFFNQLEYCKKIINSYSELSKYKGSKRVIDILSDVFKDDINTMSVTKYLIYHDLGANEIKFVQVPYSSSNSIASINEALDTNEDYNTVTSKDNYWNGPEDQFDENNAKLPESVLKRTSLSIQPTKYLGLSVATDISSYLYKTRYSISLMEYLSKNFYSLNNSAENSLYDIMSKIYVSMSLGNSSDVTNVNIITLFEATYLLYKEYNYVYERSINSQINTSNALPGTDLHYGFNCEATIDDFINNLKESPFLNNVTDHNRREVAINSLKEYYKNRYIYISNDDKKSVEYFRRDKDDPSNISSELEPTGTQPYYVMPLRIGEYVDNQFSKLFTEYPDNSDTLSFVEEMNDILDSINLLTIMNKSNHTIINGNHTGSYGGQIEDAFNYFNALHMYEKYSGNTQYPTESDIKNTDSNSIGLSSIYNSVLGKVLSFPNDYLNGKYLMKNVSANENNVFLANHNVRTFTDVLFETFFMTEDVSGIGMMEEVNYSYNSDGIPTNKSKELYKKLHIKKFDQEKGTKNIIDFIFGSELYDDNETAHEKYIKTFTSESEYGNVADIIFKKLQLCSESLNSILLGFTNISMYFGIEESKNEMLNFIAELTKIFISYTTSIYSISSSHIYDSGSEAVPLTDDFSDELNSEYEDDLYYDENIEITVEKETAV